MPNVNVFRGSDATLVLAVEDSESQEGQLADGLISQYDLSSVVARLQQVQVKVENDVYPYHEIGQRFASELRPGNINISGTARRAHINGAMIRLLLGDGAASPPPGDAGATNIQHGSQPHKPRHPGHQRQSRALWRQV